MDETIMNTRLKQAFVSYLLCSMLIIYDMDLSYLKTSLKEAYLRVTETRKGEFITEGEKHTVVLPNEAFVITRENVLGNMSTYVQSAFVDEMATVTGLTASTMDANCRGSPLNRSP
jgi:hypothetical protein